MNPHLRLAWTQIVTADDYEEHMTAIGQAQAAAALTQSIIQATTPLEGARLVIVGAGTGQMLDFMDASLLRPFQITCTDLNRSFLLRLEERLTRYGLQATILEDDIEHTMLSPGPDLLLATLVLEHIDWRRGVEVFAELRPQACGVIMQENPVGMLSAVTPDRRVPPSIAKAVEIAHPTLVPQTELIAAFDGRGYECRARDTQEVADGKRLITMRFAPRMSHRRKDYSA
ncbi:MAG: class I SAM-dependent methyltransferase [Acidobacteriaceae bacterium]|nr:class I SAM-dependent methyltransferase [Acidobacteriaceae bacterium]